MDKRISAGISLAIILSVAILIGGFLWWAYYLEIKTGQDTALTGKNQPAPGSSALDQKNAAGKVPGEENSKAGEAMLAQNVIYKSEKLGFSLEIPKAWEGKYKAVETPNSASGGFEEEGGIVSFQFKTGDPKWIREGSDMFEAFSILAYPSAKLESLKKECKSTGSEWMTCRVVDNQTGKNEKYAFSYMRSARMADYPSDFSQDTFSQTDAALRTFLPVTAVEPAASQSWKLIGGNLLDNCSKPTYEGEATIHGWYEWDYVYVEKDWVLKIAAEDQNKLPVYYYDEQGKAHYPDGARLVDGTPEMVKKLKVASKANPMELIVKGFSTYCEGSPSVSLESGSTAFNKN
jgi:hypothetical protein